MQRFSFLAVLGLIALGALACESDSLQPDITTDQDIEDTDDSDDTASESDSGVVLEPVHGERCVEMCRALGMDCESEGTNNDADNHRYCHGTVYTHQYDCADPRFGNECCESGDCVNDIEGPVQFWAYCRCH